MAGVRVKDNEPTLLRWGVSFGEDGHEDPRPLRKVKGPGVGGKGRGDTGVRFDRLNERRGEGP